MHYHKPNPCCVGITNIPAELIGRDGIMRSCQPAVVEEHALTVQIQGTDSHHFLCIRQDLRELIIGYLVSEGWISDISELLKITFNDSDSGAEVQLIDRRAPNTQLKALPPSSLDLGALFTAVNKLSQGFDIYSTTRSTHSCQLWSKGELVQVFEDLGRHNAVDKAIGYAYIQGLDPRDCFLFTSCRIPTDLVKKVIRSGFPILASKSVPTRQAVELAREYGLKMVCQASPDSIVLYQ